MLNQKIADKKAELDDTISYYSQREAEYETKIDELMTRLQEQTATYMKLQAEFDNYEWYEDGETAAAGVEEGEGEEGQREGTMSRRSRDSPMLRSRPPTRPPTREEVIHSLTAKLNHLHSKIQLNFYLPPLGADCFILILTKPRET